MISLSDKKLILITLGKAEVDLSSITKRYSIYYQESQAVAHLCQSVGYLRDAINSLNKEIIKESKNGDS